MGQLESSTVLHLVNSPSISFEAWPSHGLNRRVEPSFKIIAFQMRRLQFNQCLGSWVWKVCTGWYHFLSQLHPLKLFVLKKELRLSRWPRFLLKSFFLSFKIHFFLKFNIFFFCFAFYLVIMSIWFFLWVLTTSLGFTNVLFFNFFLIDFFSWFHHFIFWFLRIDYHYFLVFFYNIRLWVFSLKYNTNTWIIFFILQK
jgi:hypothetical protein